MALDRLAASAARAAVIMIQATIIRVHIFVIGIPWSKN
jgi:hypothetical protein